MFGSQLKLISLSIATSLLVLSCNGEDSNKTNTNAQNKTNNGTAEVAEKPLTSHTSTFSTNSVDGEQKDLIRWTSFTEGVKDAKAKNKYMFINFYTDWCGFCKKLNKTTYREPKIYNYINDKFIPIRVNAESQKKIVFQGKEITEQELAFSFGVSSYPNMFFMSSEKDAIGHLPGFLEAEELYLIANYVATDAFKTVKTIDEYKKTFKG